MFRFEYHLMNFHAMLAMHTQLGYEGWEEDDYGCMKFLFVGSPNESSKSERNISFLERMCIYKHDSNSLGLRFPAAFHLFYASVGHGMMWCKQIVSVV